MPTTTTPVDFHKRYPQLGTDAVSTDIYWKPEIFVKELESIFRPAWHYVGREEQIKNVGDFFVKELVSFATSVLITRDKEKHARAFLNACVHRGNQLELKDEGRRGAFYCKFHGWSYGLNGEIEHIPDVEGFPALDCKNLRLKTLKMDVWQGFLFVCLEDKPEQTLQDYLGRQGKDLEGYPFNKCTTKFKFEATINTNWKTMIDSFCESYHLPALHNRTIKTTMAGPNNPLGRAGDIKIKGVHRALAQHGNLKYQPKPVQSLGMRYSPGSAITSGGKGGKEQPKGINENQSSDWIFDVNIFFPNLILAMTPSMYLVHQVWPLAANKTRYELSGYLRPATNAAHRFGQQQTIVELRDVVLEDFRLLERQQKNIETGMIKEIYFHDHEMLLRYHNYTIQCKIQGVVNNLEEATR